MTTTTQYGTWHTLTGGSTATLEDSVAEFLGEFAADFDAADYRAAINDVLPDGVTLNGDIVFGPAEGIYQFEMPRPYARPSPKSI